MPLSMKSWRQSPPFATKKHLGNADFFLTDPCHQCPEHQQRTNYHPNTKRYMRNAHSFVLEPELRIPCTYTYVEKVRSAIDFELDAHTSRFSL